ncbi:MAG: acyltransferase, partial [Coriobacteriales bacterium]|nr:acyltransferase [Coriobacteriales bacterium]
MEQRAQYSPRRAPSRYVWLSSLRAFGVVLVLIYHFFPAVLPAGFLGVDVFFVFSGFLITSLLVREYSVKGSISLGAFYLRRLKRLLPAIIAMLVVILPLALLISPDFRVGIAEQVAAVLGWVTNYYEILNGQSYANQLLPHLFVHTWTLSIEMQYYLIWGLVLWLVIPRVSQSSPRGRISTLPARRVLSIVAAAAALASFVMMQVFLIGADDPSRAYFDTLSHAYPLLIGSLIGLVAGFPRTRLVSKLGRMPFSLAMMVAALCLAGIVALTVFLSFESRLSYHLGILLTALLAGTALVMGRAQQPRLARIRENRVVNYLADRSYSLYLFHWPLFIIANNLGAPGSPLVLPNFPFLDAWVFPPLALVATFVLAHLSFRYVETPFTSAGRARKLALSLALEADHAAATAPVFSDAQGENVEAVVAQGEEGEAVFVQGEQPEAEDVWHHTALALDAQGETVVGTEAQEEYLEARDTWIEAAPTGDRQPDAAVEDIQAEVAPAGGTQREKGEAEDAQGEQGPSLASRARAFVSQIIGKTESDNSESGRPGSQARILAVVVVLVLVVFGGISLVSAPAKNTVTLTNEEQLLALDVSQISSLSSQLARLHLDPVVGLGTTTGLPAPPSAGEESIGAPQMALENMENRLRGNAELAQGTITVLGDSVCLGAVPQIEELTGAYVDAEGNRKMLDAVPMVESLQASKSLGEYVVIALSTNVFANSAEKAQELIEVLEPGHHLIFVTGHGIDLEQYGFDAYVRSLPSRYSWV